MTHGWSPSVCHISTTNKPEQCHLSAKSYTNVIDLAQVWIKVSFQFGPDLAQIQPFALAHTRHGLMALVWCIPFCHISTISKPEQCHMSAKHYTNLVDLAQIWIDVCFDFGPYLAQIQHPTCSGPHTA